jgi:hypothetical protein
MCVQYGLRNKRINKKYEYGLDTIKTIISKRFRKAGKVTSCYFCG